MRMSDTEDDEVSHKIVKITFLGEPSAGKSTLCARYAGSTASYNTATQGADVTATVCTALRPSVPLQMCDVAGTALNTNMLDNYLYASQIILLVYDVTNLQSFERLTEWLSRVRKAFIDEDRQPLIAVFGNKSDLEHQRAVRLSNVQRFAEDNNLDHYRGSARTGEGINTSITILVSQVLGLPIGRTFNRTTARKSKVTSNLNQNQNGDQESGNKKEPKHQQLIMNLIEKYTDNVRFCIICNYLSKIIPALQSRCTRFRFAPLRGDQIKPRLEEVARQEGVQLSEDGVKALLALSGGDMRKVLNTLQSTWLAYKSVTEDNVYTCVGHPLRSDIQTIVQALLNESDFGACFKKINEMKINKGLALSDILTEVHVYIHRAELPSEALVSLLMKMSDMEQRLSSGCSESIELAALIAAFQVARNMVKVNE